MSEALSPVPPICMDPLGVPVAWGDRGNNPAPSTPRPPVEEVPVRIFGGCDTDVPRPLWLAWTILQC